MKRKVLVVTGSRAEYGAMRPVFRAITESRALALEMLVTGMHLEPSFAASRAEIETDAFCARHSVAMTPRDDSGAAMAIALGEGTARIADAMHRVAPDIVLVQGDRGEMLAATVAAAHQNIPVVHMSGGDHTGSIDDSIRNAITAFAHVHLTTCAQSTARIIAMGESCARVFEVGEPALDVILALEPIPDDELERDVGIDVRHPFVLATQHPVTTEVEVARDQMCELLEALAAIGLPAIVTYPNTDAGGSAMVDELERRRDRGSLRIVPHLGSRRYLSLMRRAAVLVGNSSSGIIEAPSFGLPVVNVGTRQHRRTRASNVIDVAYDRSAIRRGIELALTRDFRAACEHCRNPYGDGTCARRTVEVLARLRLGPALVTKWLDHGIALVD